MTDDSNQMPWTPAAVTEQMQEAGERMMDSQMELFKRFVSANAGGLNGFSDLNAMSMGTAMFKTRVQSGGRISIPDAEREALDIEDGDIVQTVVIPIKRTDRDD